MRSVALVLCTLTTLLVLTFAAAAPAAKAGSHRREAIVTFCLAVPSVIRRRRARPDGV